MLAKEVKKSPSQTQNALLVVVAVLIATTTYQAVVSPPDGLYIDKKYTAAVISSNLHVFSAFIVPNSIYWIICIACSDYFVLEYMQC
jgi:hypothetical protein